MRTYEQQAAVERQLIECGAKCIPPNTEANQIYGRMQLQIIALHLAIHEPIIYKFNLWGAADITCSTNNCILAVRTTFSNLSAYLYDMGSLLIKCVRVMQKGGSFIQHSTVGFALLNLKRYFINSSFNDFSQDVCILDKNKKQIGELRVSVNIDMFNKNISDRQKKKINEINKQNNQTNNLNILLKQINHSGAQAQSLGYEHHSQIINNYLAEKSPNKDTQHKQRRDSLDTSVLLQRPKHSNLSIIRQHYGINSPAIQLMKLRLDEAKYLSSLQHPIALKSEGANLLLKTMTCSNRAVPSSLTIKVTNTATINTILNIQQEMIKDKNVDLNHMMRIRQLGRQTNINFENKEAFGEIKGGDIRHKEAIALKRKDNGKIWATISYVIVNEEYQTMINGDMHKLSGNQKDKEKTRQFSQKKVTFVHVQTDRQWQVWIKVPKMEPIYGPKLIQQGLPPKSSIKIEIWKGQNLLKQIIVKVGSLMKEQYHQLENGSNAKVTVIYGVLQEVFKLIEITNTKAIVHENNSKVVEPQHEDQKQLKRWQAEVMSCIYQCENQRCSQMVVELLSDNMRCLPTFIKEAQINQAKFRAVYSRLYRNNFCQFWSNFTRYRQWNVRYRKIQQILLRNIKMEKNINYPKYINRIIHNIRYNNTLLFGLVSLQLLQKQLRRNKSQQQYQNQFNNILLILFNRFINNSLKPNQIEEFINHHQILNLNAHLIQIIYAEDNLAENSSKHEHSPLVQLLLSSQEQDVPATISQISEPNESARQHYLTSEPAEHTNIEIGNNFSEPHFKTDPNPSDQNASKSYPIPKHPIQISQSIIITICGIEGVNWDKILLSGTIIRDLPYALEIPNTQTQVMVCCGDKVYNGIYLPSKDSQIVVIYEDRVPVGKIVFNDEFKEDSMIKINVEDKHEMSKEDKHVQIENHIVYEDILIEAPKANTPKIKLTITNMAPTLCEPNITINGKHINSTLVLNNQDSYILQCRNYAPVTLFNYLGQQNYSIQRPNNTLVTVITFFIEEYYDEPLNGNFYFICNLISIYSLRPLPPINQLIVQENQYISHTLIRSPEFINHSIVIRNFSPCRLRLINKGVQICAFNFRLISSLEKGIYRSQRTLIAKDQSNSYRLQLEVFEVNYNCSLDMIQPALQVFYAKHKTAILSRIFKKESLLSAESYSSMQIFQALKGLLKFRLTHLHQLMDLDPKWFLLLQTAPQLKVSSELSVSEIALQYEAIDNDLQGCVPIQKANLINELVFSQGFDLADFRTDKLGKILDLNATKPLVDYLQILHRINGHNKLQKQHSLPFSPQKEACVSEYFQFQLLEYIGLSYCGRPCNLLFEVNGIKLCQPIIRRYSHKYMEPYPTVCINGAPFLTVLDKQFNQKGSTYSYKKIAELNIGAHENVASVLNGNIYFKIKPISKQIYEAVSSAEIMNNNKKSYQNKALDHKRFSQENWEDCEIDRNRQKKEIGIQSEQKKNKNYGKKQSQNAIVDESCYNVFKAKQQKSSIYSMRETLKKWHEESQNRSRERSILAQRREHFEGFEDIGSEED